MLIIMSTQAVFAADSYLRWVYWENEKSHIATQTEMAAIIDMIATDNVKPNLVYTLATGVSFRIPKPDLYLEYLLRCIKKSDPTVVTIQDAVEAVLGGDAVEWGNDISYRVKNYYFSSKNNRVQYIDNYTGVESRTRFLLIKGNSTIKLDCGNPTEIIGDVVIFSRPDPIPVTEPIVQEETPPPPKVRRLTVQEALVIDIEIGTGCQKSVQPPEINRRGWIKPVLISTGAVLVIIAVVKFILPLFCRGGDPGGAPTTIPPIIPGGPGGAPTTK